MGLQELVKQLNDMMLIYGDRVILTITDGENEYHIREIIGKQCAINFELSDNVSEVIIRIDRKRGKRMTREDAILHMTLRREELKNSVSDLNEDIKAFNMAIKALEQEPFINKPCVSEKVCEHDKNVVLGKIRAEIEQNAYPIVHGVNSHEKGMTLYGILQVINKYKTESQDESNG